MTEIESFLHVLAEEASPDLDEEVVDEAYAVWKATNNVLPEPIIGVNHEGTILLSWYFDDDSKYLEWEVHPDETEIFYEDLENKSTFLITLSTDHR